MSSGHTHRGGRQGNGRRARSSPPRQQNGPIRVTQATSMLATPARSTPIQAPREHLTNGVAEAAEQRQSVKGPNCAPTPTTGENLQVSQVSETRQTRTDKRGPQLIPPSQSARLHAVQQMSFSEQQTPEATTQTTAQGGADEPEVRPFIVTGRPQRTSGVSNELGERQPIRPEARGDVGSLIDSLHALFAQDRATASQGGTTRCGICFLHFSIGELEYREIEGYYVCHDCARALGGQALPMVRRQQRLS